MYFFVNLVNLKTLLSLQFSMLLRSARFTDHATLRAKIRVLFEGKHFSLEILFDEHLASTILDLAKITLQNRQNCSFFNALVISLIAYLLTFQ